MARMNPDPSTAWWVVVVIIILLGAIANVVSMIRGRGAQKRQVTFGEEFAPRGETARRLDKVEQDIREVNQQRRADVAAIHNELTAVRESVAGVETETRNLNNSVDQMRGEMREMNRQLGVLIGRGES